MKGKNALWQCLLRSATTESRNVEIGGPDAGKDLAPVLSPKILTHPPSRVVALPNRLPTHTIVRFILPLGLGIICCNYSNT